MCTPDFQTPLKTRLLWVYEGLTEYLGEVLMVRCRPGGPEGIPGDARRNDRLARPPAKAGDGDRWKTRRRPLTCCGAIARTGTS